MITIVDYGVGNLSSVQRALTYLGRSSLIASDGDTIARAERIILPGVGHFSSTARLKDNGTKDAIRQAIQRGTPFLGICLGMQWLYEGSEEAPEQPGLGLFQGRSKGFPTNVKSPHVGWNSVHLRGSSRLLKNIQDGVFTYYTHSYRVAANEGTAVTEYSGPFVAAVEKDNVFGVQFHPEKSSVAGLTILTNFCQL